MSLYKPRKLKKHEFSDLTIRIEANHDGSCILWSIKSRDLSVQAKGQSRSRIEAMQRAALVVEGVANAAAWFASDKIVSIDSARKSDSDEPDGAA